MDDAEDQTKSGTWKMSEARGDGGEATGDANE